MSYNIDLKIKNSTTGKRTEGRKGGRAEDQRAEGRGKRAEGRGTKEEE
jgi:hypothetical protein